MTAVVRSQQEFDTALAALDGDYGVIEIRSPKGVWISVGATDSATVRASDSATVRASGSATVEASGSATVRAWDSATVRASGSATVRAWDSATVEATPHVAVHLHSTAATIHGGVLIDVTKINDDGPRWLEHHGIEVSDAGIAIVYKAVNDEWTTSRGFDYSPGARPNAPDWTDRPECGGGLHFGPTPWMAKLYHPEATRFVACEVLASELIPIPGPPAKAKARECTVLYECDIDGVRLEQVIA